MVHKPIEAVEAGMSFYKALYPDLDVRKLAPMWHIFTVGHIVGIDLDRLARRFGLSIADIHLIGTVRIERQGPIRAIDLAHTLDVSQAALSVRIDRLIRQGFLLKTRQREDRRAFTLRLTEMGAKVADESVMAFCTDAKLVRALGKLCDADLDALNRILGTLHEELDRSVVAGMPENT